MPDTKIAVANIEWSDDYQGCDAVGYYGGNGNEKFNFSKFKGVYRAYVARVGTNFPNPKETSGWTVFFVSRHPDKRRMYVVGWYENAKFLAAESRVRPDADRLGPNPEGEAYTYSVSSKHATLVPASARRDPIPKGYIHRSFFYARGNGAGLGKAAVADWLLAYRDKVKQDGFEVEAPEEQPRLGFCGDAKRRREIELLAEAAVIQAMKGWECERKSDEQCGYDLRFWKRNGEEVRVEVKGTSLDVPQFFISERELSYGKDFSINDNRARQNKAGQFRPLWKLAVVSAVDTARDVRFFTYGEIANSFDLKPYAHRGTWKKPE